jgi:NADPH2:quinone reductase
MKAAYIERTGPPSAICYGELPAPNPSERQVLVKVAAVTVNPIDTYIRSGGYPIELPIPFIVGRDMTGMVIDVGTAVTRFKAGDLVWCNNQGYDGRQGTFAEQLAIDESLLYPLPKGVDPIAAVAVLHSGLTAVTGLLTKARPQAGESVFIAGGDGNVGTAVLQLAKSAGARVAVTAGSKPKAEWCQELGADRVIDYHTEDVDQALREFAPQGIDIYWDASGKPDIERALGVLAHRGRIVLMSGLTHRCTLPVGMFYTHNCTMFGFTVTNATSTELGECATEINRLLTAGSLKAKVHAILPLSQSAEAHQLVEQGKVFGKIVLVPQG